MIYFVKISSRAAHTRVALTDERTGRVLDQFDGIHVDESAKSWRERLRKLETFAGALNRLEKILRRPLKDADVEALRANSRRGRPRKTQLRPSRRSPHSRRHKA